MHCTTCVIPQRWSNGRFFAAPIPPTKTLPPPCGERQIEWRGPCLSSGRIASPSRPYEASQRGHRHSRVLVQACAVLEELSRSIKSRPASS